ncbi:MAG: TetR/AcrR family transcriptional regulator [Candidatus Aquicultorales bacterium]
MPKESTKERILDAALELFAEKGFASTTTKEIAAGAGINEVTLFRHYGTKANLFQEGVARFSPLETLTKNVDDRLTGDLVHDLELLARNYLDIAQSRIRYIKVAIGELNRTPELLEAVSQVLMYLGAHLESHLKDLRKSGRIPDGDYRLLSQMFYTLLFQYVLVRDVFMSGLYEATADEFVETCVSLFAQGLQADPDGKKRGDLEICHSSK